MDLLSELPPCIANIILAKLPIRDAVRTSILSRQWRYRWTKIPRLVFDRYVQLSAYQHRYLYHDECNENTTVRIGVINQILLQHTGSRIDHFHCFLESSPHIDRWIRFLSTRSLKELLLDIRGDDDDYEEDRCQRYLVHSSLFTCVQLTRLELSFCSLKPPAAKVFDAWFPNLRILRLWRVAFSGDEVAERLIAGSPLLEELTLRDFTGISGLKIRAPSLWDVCIVGELEWVCFENAPRASEVSVVLVPSGSGRRMFPPGMAQVLGGLLGVERLHLGFSLQFLAAGYIPKQLPIIYDHLKNVKLHMNFGDLKEIFAAICLLRSSPSLEKLRIMPSSTTISTKQAVDFWGEQVNLDCVLSHLNTVKFKLICGEKVEVEFMKFVLASSPVLDKMVIKPRMVPKKRRMNILKELRRTKKASVQAKILYLDEQ